MTDTLSNEELSNLRKKLEAIDKGQQDATLTEAGIDPAVIDKAVEDAGEDASIWDKLASLVTGRGRTEFPDMPEITERDVGIARGEADPDAFMGAYSGVNPQFQLGRHMTDHDSQMQDILKDTLGENAVKFWSDADGNTVVNIDGKDFYVNKPGFSAADWDRLSGQLASFSPGSRWAAMGSRMIRMFKSGAIFSGAQAKRDAASVALGAEFNPDETTNKVLLAGALGVLGVPIGDVAFWGAKSTYAALKPYMVAGRLNDDGVKALEAAGVDVATLEPQLRRMFISLQAKHGTDVATSRTIARTLPDDMDVPLSAGDVSQSVPVQQREYQMEGGSYGETAQEIGLGFRGQQQEAIESGVTTLQGSVGTGTAPLRNEGTKAAQLRLREKRDLDYQSYKWAYGEAESGSASLPRNARQDLFDDITEIGNSSYLLKQDKFTSMRDDLSAIMSNEGPDVPVNSLFDWRRDLTTLKNASTDPTEQLVLGRMLKNFDNAMDDYLERGLFLGDPATVKWWKTAIDRRKKFGEKWEQKKWSDPNYLQSKLTDTKNGQLIVSEDEAANYILNASDFGFITKSNLNRNLRNIKDLLGKESPEWQGITDEVLTRFIQNARGADDVFRPRVMLKNWAKLRQNNRALMDTMFTINEQQMINRWLFNAAKAGQKQPLGHNPSNTSIFRDIGLVKMVRTMKGIREAKSSYAGTPPTVTPPEAQFAATAGPATQTPGISQQYPNLGYGLAQTVAEPVGGVYRGITGLLGPREEEGL